MLDSAQKAKLDAAHEARRKMWNTNRVARQAEYAALTKELSTDKFDPRDVIALRKKTRAKIDAGFDEVQATWLAFWDVLNAAQRKILIGYMRDQHAVQGKASAAASAERAAARAKQQAALDRAEARAAAQGGSTSSATTAPAGAVSHRPAPSGRPRSALDFDGGSMCVVNDGAMCERNRPADPDRFRGCHVRARGADALDG